MAKNGPIGKESRKRLLEVAAAEFSNHGYHDTKISSIVAGAGLSQPSFYLYFSSKEAIFAELVLSFRDGLQQVVEASLIEPEVPSEELFKRIEKSVSTVFRYLSQNPDLTQVGFFHSPYAADIKAEMVSMTCDNLIAEQRSGFFRPELDMRIVAECLVGSIERLTSTQLLPGLAGPDELASQLVSIFLYSMKRSSSC